MVALSGTATNVLGGSWVVISISRVTSRVTILITYNPYSGTDNPTYNYP